MLEKIEKFKKEVSELEAKKKNIEHAIIKMQTQYETAINALKNEFNISPEQLDSLIKDKEDKLKSIEEKITISIEKMRSYIEKIGSVLNA